MSFHRFSCIFTYVLKCPMVTLYNSKISTALSAAERQDAADAVAAANATVATSTAATATTTHVGALKDFFPSAHVYYDVYIYIYICYINRFRYKYKYRYAHTYNTSVAPC